jgi:hypothetical protein
MSCAWLSACCCCHGSNQPVNTSQKAICSANDATVGTCDTINSLIVNGSRVLTAGLNDLTQTKATAVKAQTQLAQSSIYAGALVVIAILAVAGFLLFGRKRSA